MSVFMANIPANNCEKRTRSSNNPPNSSENGERSRDNDLIRPHARAIALDEAASGPLLRCIGAALVR